MNYYFRKILIATTLCFTCLCTAANAANNSVKLKGLQNQIAQVKTDISKKEKQQTSVEQQLKNLKTKIKTLESRYRTTVNNLKSQKNILTKLNRNQTKQLVSLKEAQQKLSAQLVTAYQIEPPSYLKTVFNKENKVSINPNQLLTYHKYIFIARLEQMHNIKNTLGHIEQNKQRIKKQTKILEKLEIDQRQQKAELSQAQQEYGKILGELKNKIASQNHKLKRLLIAKKSLEKLITRLAPRKTIAISPKLMVQLCRHFVWPTKGIISIHYGSPIEQSSWSWSGIIITAPENQGIRAISSGRVVYAGWFNGYGLLLIIDHGSGYMSLYGHNKSLYKKVNDTIEAGEIVAAVGRSGCDEVGLYFAIRYNGKPVDPERWCR